MAPLIKAVTAHSALEPWVVVTGQHREMLDQVHEVFEIRPDVDLNLMQANQTLGDFTVRALSGIQAQLVEARPAAVVVQGDTTSTLAAALAAFYSQVPVVHLEAGLRSGDKTSPYPEEMNRRLVSQLGDLHLAPTPGNRDLLLCEGIDPGHIVVTGNTVIDALMLTVTRGAPYVDRELDRALTLARASRQRIATVTTHRRESWGDPMRATNRALGRLAMQFPDVLWVVPVHRNPRVRADLLPGLVRFQNILLIEPLSYPDFCRLLSESVLVLTDSGGVQEEAPSLGVPVLVLRDTTERPEAVSHGAAALVGTDEEAVVAGASRLLSDPVAHASMAHAVNPYGDGRAAERAVAAIANLLGVGQRLPDFSPLAPG